MNVTKINKVEIRASISISPIRAKAHITIRIKTKAASGVFRLTETWDNSLRAFVDLDIASKTLELPSILDNIVLEVANKAMSEITMIPALPYFRPMISAKGLSDLPNS